MIICPKCFTDNGNKDTHCRKCGRSILGISEAENQENIWKWRHKARLKGHMVTGVILCFGLPTLFGLPSSLLPDRIFLNLVFGFVFGIPLGYLVSNYAESIVGGAAIGSVIGIVYCVVTMIIFGRSPTISSVLMGIGTGIVPGGIMGLHVEMDD